MKREKLKNILEVHYKSEHTIESILSGKRRPRYEIIVEMSKSNKIPFSAWMDIKSYLQENNTKTQLEHTNTKG